VITAIANFSSADGLGAISVTPMKQNGNPTVVIVIRTDVPGVMQATLDGHPAIAVFLSDDGTGSLNAPWELGHLLAAKWEEAKKLP
jgi:hypothetical protein